jgi:hypothetical protein
VIDFLSTFMIVEGLAMLCKSASRSTIKEFDGKSPADQVKINRALL